jgi:hypothetical protein
MYKTKFSISKHITSWKESYRREKQILEKKLCENRNIYWCKMKCGSIANSKSVRKGNKQHASIEIMSQESLDRFLKKLLTENRLEYLNMNSDPSTSDEIKGKH